MSPGSTQLVTIFAVSKDGEKGQRNKSEEELQSELPSQVVFVEEVTGLFQKHLPDLWKLGQAYFAGDLFVVEVCFLV